MNCCRETTKMGLPPGNRPAVPRDWFRGVPERYVAGADTRGRQEGRPYPWSQQVIHETSGLDEHDWLKPVVRVLLMPLVGISYILVRISLVTMILLGFMLIISAISFYMVIYRRRKYQT